MTDESTTGLAALAAEAYVYGYPLVFDLEQVIRSTTEGVLGVPATPYNRLAHARRLAGAADTFVTVNNDTVYSIAQLDLGDGPLLLEVPNTGGRYYVLQFIDAWTNNFAYVGRRAAGTAAGRYLLVPPRWDGRAAEDATIVPVPTRVATLLGRWACEGEHDLPAVAALQDALTLTPLHDGDAPALGVPVPDPHAVAEMAFFERLRTWMQAFAPSSADQDYQQRFAPLGLLDADSPYATPDPDLAQALQAGEAAGKRRIDKIGHSGTTAPVNGWTSGLHMFDYNVDHLGPGTIDDPKWKIGDRARARVERAVADRLGLWGNHGYEAVYAQAFTTGDGTPLTGADRCTLRFQQPPPVDAFWSLTLYDVPDYYLVANPIGRYSIGDRTPDLHTAPDGTITIHIQHDEPAEPAQRANWLPAPAGPYRLVMRLYQPRQAILDGTYTLPPITRT